MSLLGKASSLVSCLNWLKVLLISNKFLYLCVDSVHMNICSEVKLMDELCVFYLRELK